MATPPNGHFVFTGTGILPGTLAASTYNAAAMLSSGTGVGTRYDLGRAYSNWGLRVKLTTGLGAAAGSATSGEIILYGTIATSSDANGALRPMTTWKGSVNSSDDTLWVTGFAATSILAAWSTPSSSATAALFWVCGA